MKGETPYKGSDLTQYNWRRYMAQQLAQEMDFAAFGVLGVYLIGSTETDTPGPGSDIDLIIHIQNTPEQQALLLQWLAGWDLALCSMNRLLTGLQSEFMLDVHFVTGEDIHKGAPFAKRISSLHEPAEPLRTNTTLAGKEEKPPVYLHKTLTQAV